MKRICKMADIEEGTQYLRIQCPLMARMLEVCPKIPLRLSQPGFAGLAAIIISQQVSRASADAIYARFEKLISPPTAENYLNATQQTLVDIGLSSSKQRTLCHVADGVVKGRLDLDMLCLLPEEDAMARMTAIHGIGPWTAQIYLMFCAGHCDIFPAGDLALQEAIRLGRNLEVRPNDKQCRLIAEAWKPWRSVAARILWAFYAVEKGRQGAAINL